MTKGERLVRVDFNVSGISDVDEIKTLAARLIDRIEIWTALRKTPDGTKRWPSLQLSRRRCRRSRRQPPRRRKQVRSIISSPPGAGDASC